MQEGRQPIRDSISSKKEEAPPIGNIPSEFNVGTPPKTAEGQ